MREILYKPESVNGRSKKQQESKTDVGSGNVVRGKKGKKENACSAEELAKSSGAKKGSVKSSGTRKGSVKGGVAKMGVEDVVDQLEVLSEDMAVVKAYIQALQRPVLDKCNTWIDGRKAAKILHMSTRSLQNMRCSGQLPFSRIGGKFYYRVEDLEAMLRMNYQPAKNVGGGDE